MFTYAVRVLLALSYLSASGFAHASDLAKEKRWADQIVDSLIDGEAVWLKADRQPFLAIYTEATEGESLGGVIILHGIGIHPDWPQVIHPLRVQLPEHGWSTLSLQMPILPNEARIEDYAPLFDEVAPRIEAGIKFLKEQGIDKVAIAGHSLGATMASYYLAENDHPIKSFVAIGMAAGSKDPRMDNAASFQNISISMLDLYGSRDQDDVIRASSARASAAQKAGFKAYKQMQVDGADHFFDGKEDVLVDTVRDWLAEGG